MWAPYFMVAETSRFYLIQVLIGSIQLLNRFQVGLVWILNFCYLYFFFKTINKKKMLQIKGSPLVFKFIPNKIYKIKLICQEICILLILSTIFLFSMTANSNFRNSKIYKMLEYVIIVSIIITAATEFLWAIVGLVIQITRYLRKKRQKRRLERRMKRLASVYRRTEAAKSKLGKCSSTHTENNSKMSSIMRAHQQVDSDHHLSSNL